MKSKNLVLMIVAIGCGLVAAVVTARMGASTGPKMVNVWSATKELPSSTQFTEAEIANLLVPRPVPETDALEAGFLTHPDTSVLANKRLNRLIRKGEALRMADLTAAEGFRVRAGRTAMTVRVSVETVVAGFVLPGSKVDILFVERSSGKPRSIVLLQNMLILAVDTNPYRQNEQNAIPQAQTVTLDVSREEAQTLAVAMARGELRLLLRDDNDPKPYATETVVDLPFEKQVINTAPVAVEAKAPDMVDVVVAEVDVKEGEEIKEPEKFFGVKKQLKESAPANAYSSLEELKGKKPNWPLFAGSPALKAAFEKAGPVTVVYQPAAKKQQHVMIIRNGSQTLQHVFENGVEVDPLRPTEAAEPKPATKE